MLWDFLFGLCSCETDLQSGILISFFKRAEFIFCHCLRRKTLTDQKQKQNEINNLSNFILSQLDKGKKNNTGLQVVELVENVFLFSHTSNIFISLFCKSS